MIYFIFSQVNNVSFGKISPEQFLSRIKSGNCIICPALGEDDAVLKLNKKYLVIHSDPITESGLDSGFLSVVVACNDVNMKGTACKWVLTTVLLSREDNLNNIIDGINEACSLIGCNVVGGHTEVVDINRDIVVTTALGETDKIMEINSVKDGDYVVLIGDIGIEGSWILATQFQSLLRSKGVSDEVIEAAKAFKKELIVQSKALAISRLVKFMHDTTDGGLLQALFELAKRSNMTVSIREDSIPLRREVHEVTAALNIDPLKFISSGAFIAITDNPKEILSKVNGYIIGKLVKGEPIVKTEKRIINDNIKEELARIENSYNGWWKR